MPNDLAKQLGQIPLFAKLSRDDLKAVAKLANREPYPAGAEICQQGQLGQAAFFVESGLLRVLHVDPEGIEQEVARLGPGEYFGETSLMLGEPHDASVEVIQDATLLYLNKCDFDQLLDERPGILRALQMRPDVEKKRLGPHFKWQDPDEVVIAALHKHNALLAGNLVIPGLVFLAVLAGCGYWYHHTGSKLALLVGTVLGLVPILLAIYLTIDHYNDDYVVTSKRVVHEERVPLVFKSRAEAPLRSIQDIQQLQEGFLAQVYDYGDLIIETAGERGHVIFRRIPHPTQTRDEIFEQIRRMQAGARAEERAAIRKTLCQHYGMPAPGATHPSSETTGPAPRTKLAAPSWLLTPLRLFRYFMPPLRDEHGDTVTWRKHWLPLVQPIALPTALIIAATLGTIFLLYSFFSNWGIILIAYGMVMVGLSLWWLWIFDDWRNDIYQITTTRIIDVERLPLYLREERREASLGMIQNVSMEIPGFLGNLLDYGTVTIETAGAGAFTFDFVKDPRGVQSEIFRRVEAYQARQRKEATDQRRTELLDWFSVYDQVRQSNSTANPTPAAHQQET